MQDDRNLLFMKERKRRKQISIMKLSVLFLLFHFSLSAMSFSQARRVSLDLTRVSAMEFFSEIRKQTGYSFVFNESQAKAIGKLTVRVDGMPVDEVLCSVLSPVNFSYKFENDIIIIMSTGQSPVKTLKVVGKVTDEKKVVLPGVTVRLKGTSLGTSTDVKGGYVLTFPEVKTNPVLIFSFIGMETQEIAVKGRDTINVVLKELMIGLEEVVVSTGYERVDLRKTTSSIQSIKAEDILVPGLQTIDQMLEGHVPGMIFMANSRADRPYVRRYAVASMKTSSME